MRVPRLAPGCDPARLPLSPAEGYLLSRIDGATPWKLLREIGGLAPEEVDRCLARWVTEGVVLVADPAPARGPAPSSARANRSAAEAENAIDPSLDLPEETQRRILAFEARLDRPYHEILGVPPNADAKAVKRAYFELSKEYHPDRYFRRSIGAYAERLDRVFRKVLEAYELLADPATRVEVQRSLEASEPPPAPKPRPAGGPGSAPPVVAAPRPRFSPAHLRALAQRKAKAKALFEAGMAAWAASRWLEAAASVRLAIAFDPVNAAYKERFAEVQRRANDERAQQLVKEAEGSLDLRQVHDALRLFEEALHFRPHDPELNHRTAKLALMLGEDPKRAKEYAAAACELRPEVGPYRRTLGQVYKAAGLVANARRELEAAIRIDAGDTEARQELKSLGRG